MDEKHFGELPAMWRVFPGIKKNPFAGWSSKTKRIVGYTALSAVIVFTATLFSVAVITSANPSPDGSGSPFPAIFDSPVSDREVGETQALVPSAKVVFHGEELGVFEMENATVKDALENFNVTVSENDTLNYPETEKIWWGMEIKVDLVEFEELYVVETIPHDTVEIPCQTVPRGERVVKVEGIDGAVGKVMRTKVVNGEALESETVEESINLTPVTEEILVGTGGVFTSPDGTEHSYSYYIDVVATAYTHTGNRTYTGTVARVGVIAVDPRYIELGKEVYVIGNYGDYGVCTAEDIGGGIKRARIDVFLDTEEECVEFGRRNMRCYVLD